MTTQDSIIRWWNGHHQNEHEFLGELQKHIKQNKEDPQIALKDLEVFIKQRQESLVNDNKFDITPYLGYILGVTAGLGLGLFLLSESATDFGLWMIFLSLFHLWEYTYVAMFHVDSLSSNSFLLNNGWEYQAALWFSVAEYWIEWYLFPSMKGNYIFMVPGLLVVIAGQAIRTLAMYTAGSNFHHIVQTRQANSHQLVTEGIYNYFRHPSYFGWFWWSLATELLIFNPISFAARCYVSWKFFADRIPYEEEHLIKQYGNQYVEYRKRVPVLIPFIN
eukprot:TRINITY_DN3288_c0_g2_i1.p1 TRINITY_DN3288_c0_g2~~TRINITY_DN3288_c0_g2_i1.p1  ORF type:complete len:276 (+),score=41.89 TRINITY_DN3288_c0_g2_i1:3-830(+)